MIISAQSLATFLEQDYTVWTAIKQSRAREHILTAGDEVRGALAALYVIPTITRDANGNITAPLILGVPIADPVRTALGPIIKHLAAAFLLDPARGFQPQEDRSAAADYRISARGQLNALRERRAFIASLDRLDDFGITPTSALLAAITTQKSKPQPSIVQSQSQIFGGLRDPATGEVI